MFTGRAHSQKVVSGIALFLVPVFSSICVASLPSPLALAQSAPPAQQSGMVLHIETREAVIDVVARDRDNLPIADLAANEFEVYDVPNMATKFPAASCTFAPLTRRTEIEGMIRPVAFM